MTTATSATSSTTTTTVTSSSRSSSSSSLTTTSSHSVSSSCYTLPLSPLSNAFNSIQWESNHKLGQALSSSQCSLLRRAEAHPMEYTLADFAEAHTLCRLLLQVLELVTLQPSSSSAWNQDEQVLLEEEDALQVYYEQPLLVVTHFAISQLYDFIKCLLEESDTPTSSSSSSDKKHGHAVSPSKSKQRACNTIWTYFYNPIDGTLMEDWRPLLKIMYKVVGGSTAYTDTFVSRGASLCLAYILRAGCPSHQTTQQLQLHYGSTSSPISLVAEPLQALIGWITSRLQSVATNSSNSTNGINTANSTTNVRIVTPALMVLSTCHESRIILDEAGGIGYMVRHIRSMLHASNNNTMKNGRSSTKHHAISMSPSLRRVSATNDTISRSSSSSSAPSHSYSKRATIYSASVQQLYELVFCLWTMTYECCDATESTSLTRQRVLKHFRRDQAIHALCEVVAKGPREKIIRLGLNSLCNLAKLTSASDLDEALNATGGHTSDADRRSKAVSSPQAATSTAGSTTQFTSKFPFLTEMIGHELHKTLSVLKDRKWSDSDIADDMKILQKMVDDNYHEMTKYQLYEAQVQTGHLQWGILHEERFFRQNARKMEGPNGDFTIVKRLILILNQFATASNLPAASSTAAVSYKDMYFAGQQASNQLHDPLQEEEEEIASIACYDIGEFVRFYPNGKSIASNLGAKKVVLRYINHENERLQHQALVCVSKILVNRWDKQMLT